MKMKEIPVCERPVERLLSNGSEYLSNEELLAILIKTGNREFSARDLASIVLKECGGSLNDINYQGLRKIPGIGDIKSAVILAGLELGRRASRKISSLNDMQITSADIVFDYYKNIFIDKLCSTL